MLSRFSRVRLCATPETAAHQAPPSLGLSRQEHWSGLPFPSPVHQSEKWKWHRSVVSDSSLPHGLQPTRLLHPWDFPGKSTGVGVPSPSPTCMYSHSLLWSEHVHRNSPPNCFFILFLVHTVFTLQNCCAVVQSSLLFLRTSFYCASQGFQ